jgi:transcriptional regulator with XRE-family HTH domain
MLPANLLDKLNQIGPNKCRFLARMEGGRRPISQRQLARRSGLSRATIDRLSHKKRWDDVPLAQVVQFSEGCGIDLLRPKSSVRDKLKRSKQYIARLAPKQRRMYARLLAE